MPYPPDSFGGSPAAVKLLQMVEERGNDSIHRKIRNILNRFSDGLEELLKLDNPMRGDAIKWWRTFVLDTTTTLHDELNRADISFTFLDNVMHLRASQAADEGRVLEALRGENISHDAMVAELRAMRRESNRRERGGDVL